MRSKLRIGIDAGGTFTDLLALDGVQGEVLDQGHIRLWR